MDNQALFDKKSIASIYFTANTPYHFYKTMRGNFSIQEVSHLPAHNLIEEFDKLVNTPLTTMEDIAEVYAVMIALTLKPLHEVDTFFKKALNIKYEWFSDIANFYLTDPNTVPAYQVINVLPPNAIQEEPKVIEKENIEFTNIEMPSTC